MKEIKEDTSRWRTIPRSWIGEINIVKMSILPKSILQIQCNLYQATNGIFTELEEIISQFVWKYKKTRIAKVILRKKNGTGGINLPDFKDYATKLQSLRQYGTGTKKYRSMEQSRKSRDKSTHIWTPYL